PNYSPYPCAEVEKSDPFYLGLKPQAMVSAVPTALSSKLKTLPFSLFASSNSPLLSPTQGYTTP
ncbi:hypothetical protein, partial [Algoriphagus terrigena]|uniref:hypothetical protein n=1 Tax=Algoriphagus terrigena TaxID=344884 RepID=UPI001B7FB51D